MPLPSTLPIGALDPSKIPKPLPMTPGTAFEPNSLLNASSVVRLFENQVLGSESVAVAPNGRDLVMCDRYGYVWRAKRSSSGDEYELDARPLAHLGAGRPLGFHFDSDGSLLACMSGGSGLVMLESGAFGEGEEERRRARVITLTAAVSPPSPGDDDEEKEGKKKEFHHSPILYANDLDISHRTGVVYFTDSAAIGPVRNKRGFWDTMQAYVMSLAQGEPTGRLLSFDPTTGKTSVVASNLWFANGVALSPCETWAAVVETNSLRVWKIYVEGVKKGQREVLIDGLPGYPDGISRAFSNSNSNSRNSQKKQQDGFWLALVSPLQPAAKHLGPWKLGRLLMAWTPEGVRPPLKPWGAAARLRLIKKENGKEEEERVEVEGWLLDPKGEALSSTSAVTEDAGNGDRLFFGNLAGGYVSFVDGASEKVDEASRWRRRRSESGGSRSASDGGGEERSEL